MWYIRHIYKLWLSFQKVIKGLIGIYEISLFGYLPDSSFEFFLLIFEM